MIEWGRYLSVLGLSTLGALNNALWLAIAPQKVRKQIGGALTLEHHSVRKIRRNQQGAARRRQPLLTVRGERHRVFTPREHQQGNAVFCRCHRVFMVGGSESRSSKSDIAP